MNADLTEKFMDIDVGSLNTQAYIEYTSKQIESLENQITMQSYSNKNKTVYLQRMQTYKNYLLSYISTLNTDSHIEYQKVSAQNSYKKKERYLKDLRILMLEFSKKLGKKKNYSDINCRIPVVKIFKHK
ncbi:hypothetical protein SteCoe_7701 [Stentor coeruleus]|uniref:Uncharacterized protein n=1 Tax=Stentor coeruleus TaxID=5963 RepID=A0A1R2CLY1_9CILI|nr:hypothetical protein SteCoe_7701 [Stentor coeruleus]